ncbi:alpha-hydroxy-acid oxidizing protein [Streptomyces sp. ISL-98]|uniref:alpha-hydroxy acid oxidase n=1 Tax=Streptomyces sp. ISL-98 TaxID=2819192 RepID=UPI001BE76044|nr:alpha-hydroxy acid oxidase [Streptomyces sp. ISL-98]MBT2510504.1 alpha-hydroxy-acid oxidizing protein [Streptomyces sp. ISL-98]
MTVPVHEVDRRAAAVSVAEVARLAADRLPADVRDFVDGGSGDESTQAANRAALDAVRPVPRVLGGSGEADTSGTLLRSTAELPLAVAPMAYQRLLHPDGELAAARAAHDTGIPYIISTLSSYPIEEITAVGGVCWFQLYWMRDRAVALDLVRRAEMAGCEALVVTVDVPHMGRRLRDVRNGFTLPHDVRAANLGPAPDTDAAGITAAHTRQSGASAVATHTALSFDPAIGWDDLAWLREQTALPLVLKGILDPRDAVRAVGVGADGVIVSNHGGRQFPAAPPSVTALTAVLDEVGGRCAVLFDSGVRTGADILRALALGADGALCGRPVLWGLAADGEDGARHVLRLLHTELREALLLSGCPDLAAARALDVVRL